MNRVSHCALLIGILPFVMLMSAVGEVRGEPELTYTCRRATGAVTIDGKLDESDWHKAQVFNRFFPLTEDMPILPAQSFVRLIWDDQHLYVGFVFRDDDIISHTSEHDGNIWEGDAAELFLRPSMREPDYFELEFAPNGAMLDALQDADDRPELAEALRWESKAVVAVSVVGTLDDRFDLDKQWTVEVAIPWEAFAPQAERPAVGSSWRFAACRYDYQILEPEVKVTTTSPESTGFHDTERYADLVFER